jgi:hypothetical protein
MPFSPVDLTDASRYPPGRFGYLRPLRPLAGRTRRRSVVWECLCDPALGGCGRTCMSVPRVLVGGHTKSCGCMPRGKAPTAARRAEAVAQKHPAATLRAVAAMAGVSLSTAWAARRRVRGLRGQVRRPPAGPKGCRVSV